MTESNRIKRAGTATLWWGIGLIVAALIVILFGNTIYYAMVGTSTTGGALVTIVTYVLSIIQGVGLPLGSALLGAGIVMRTLAPRPVAEVFEDIEAFEDDEDVSADESLDELEETVGEEVLASLSED